MIASAVLACALSASDAAYIQDALDGWTVITRDLLELPDAPLPWMILFDRSCAYHLARDPKVLSSARRLAGASLTSGGRPVTVHAEPVTEVVRLPNGSTLPLAGRAFTSLYGEGAAAKPFFVTALPDVWAHDPKYADDPEDWPKFVLDVLWHELVHTRQILAIRDRVEGLHERFPDLPDAIDDDWLQRTFQARPGVDPTVRAEIALLHESASERDAARARELARTALALMGARRATYYADAAPRLGALEDVFLNMEGVACWSAFKLSLARNRGAAPDQALDAFRGNRKFWSQEEGLALFLALDRFAPGWKAHVFPPELTSPVELLDRALAASTGGT